MNSPKMQPQPSSFDFLRVSLPQVAKDAIRAEWHYSDTHDLQAAGSALRCCLEGFLKHFHEQRPGGRSSEESGDLRWLIDNVFAPRDGHRQMHVIRMLGNKSSHPGRLPEKNEIEKCLKELHCILQKNTPASANEVATYRLPSRRAKPLEAGRSGQLEAEIARLLEQRDAEARESVNARAKLDRITDELEAARAAIKKQAAESAESNQKLEQLAARDGERRSELTALEARLVEQQQLSSNGEAQRRQLDTKLASVQREMAELQEIHTWSDQFPGGNWSEVPAFIVERLETGRPPFQEWHIAPSIIGKGAFGKVYICFPSNDGVPVAVKVPLVRGNPDQLKAVWEGECASARRVAALFAENKSLPVPKPLQVAPEGVDAFITYELIEGEDLSSLLGASSSRGTRWQLTPFQALFIVDQLAVTVDALLQAGVRHTDLSPRNVILRSPHDPVLIDYAPCVPGDTRPPEWAGLNPQECPVDRTRSGQLYLLAIILVRMLGIDQLPTAHSFLSSDMLDSQLISDEGDAEWEAELSSAISKRLENFDRGAREELRDLLLDLLDPDDTARSTMRFSSVSRVLRSAYDPDGLIGTIFGRA